VANHRERFHKVLAIAINPGAPEGEATAALHRARELVKKDPSLAHPAPNLAAAAAIPDRVISNIKVTNIPQLWLAVLLSSASEEAYDLGLRIRMSCDFSQALTAVSIKCDGPENTSALFEAYLNRLVVLMRCTAWVITAAQRFTASERWPLPRLMKWAFAQT
jgi:hypothetical protein